MNGCSMRVGWRVSVAHAFVNICKVQGACSVCLNCMCHTQKMHLRPVLGFYMQSSVTARRWVVICLNPSAHGCTFNRRNVVCHTQRGCLCISL
jgi:hypothetical protein